jgi:hypothetical protein
MWTRQCPNCGQRLAKIDPMEIVHCLCGWVWS